jgi:truncated hemoglobin YjbI
LTKKETLHLEFWKSHHLILSETNFSAFSEAFYRKLDQQGEEMSLFLTGFPEENRTKMLSSSIEACAQYFFNSYSSEALTQMALMLKNKGLTGKHIDLWFEALFQTVQNFNVNHDLHTIVIWLVVLNPSLVYIKNILNYGSVASGKRILPLP